MVSGADDTVFGIVYAKVFGNKTIRNERVKILITGKNSYIGNSFADYVHNLIEIEKCSLRDEEWKSNSWAGIDVILHVAGIAHSDVSHVTDEEKNRYYEVNRNLTKLVAEKAKRDGVGQFIYLSSAIVYGESSKIGKAKLITSKTEPSPANFYGDSKLQGEKVILPLQSENFQVAIIRTPMVYGRNAKGNFSKLLKFSGTLPVFPKIQNRRSMIYMENLCEFIVKIIEKKEQGIFLPQNKEIVSTSLMVKLLAEVQGKRMFLMPGLQWIFRILAHMTGYVNKIFGNLEYDQDASHQDWGYCKFSLKESLERICNG